MRPSSLVPLALALACASAQPEGTTPDVPAAEAVIAVPTPAEPRILPIGTRLVARLDHPIDAGSARVGDHFGASVVQIEVPGVLLGGARLIGHLSAVRAPSRPGEPGAVGLAFDQLRIGTEVHPLEAHVVRAEIEGPGGDRRLLGNVLSSERGLPELQPGGTLIAVGEGGLEPLLPAGTRFVLRTTRSIDLDAPSESLIVPEQ